MSLSDLYQEVILDHNRRPRNSGKLEGANASAVGHNPLCGDRIEVHLKVENGRISGIKFEGSGCAISTASTSMMTEAVLGTTPSEALAMVERVRAALTTEHGSLESAVGEDSEILSLGGVKEFPIRVKCATLAWHTLAAALSNRDEVTTEEAEPSYA